jgi:exodeoxyribonuclease V alpha subunit
MTYMQGSIVEDQLSGVVSRVFFLNDTTGTCAFSIVAEGKTHKAKGVLPEVQPGMAVVLFGEWTEHRQWGPQLNFKRYEVPTPSSKEDAIAYLTTLRRCGNSTAKLLWDRFGDDIFRIIEEEPSELGTISGIGDATVKAIVESYKATKRLRDLIGFLGSLGVGATYAKRIDENYGVRAIEVIQQDPYILAKEVSGFGFRKADDIARGLNISEDSPKRIRAGVLHVLGEETNIKGHCYVPASELVRLSVALLRLPCYIPTQLELTDAIYKMAGERLFYIFDTSQLMALDQRDRCEQVWPVRLWDAEDDVAGTISSMAGKYNHEPLVFLKDGDGDDVPCTVSEFIDVFCAGEGRQLDETQADAVHTAAINQVFILTGGPGTGKSTTSKAIVQLFHHMKLRIVMAAPTGMAAKRLRQATGYEAETIHRLLQWDGSRFNRNRDNQLEGDVFLLDETSMVNLPLFAAFVRALPRTARLILVGDRDQLEAIGPGSVLGDLIDSGQIPSVQLKQVYRQSEGSMIALHCRSVNQGVVPKLEEIPWSKEHQAQTDSLFLKVNREDIPSAVRWIASDYLPSRDIDVHSTQVLLPQKTGNYGTYVMNKICQDVWNPSTHMDPEIASTGIREQDRIIQLRNDYDRQIWNGDQAVVQFIDLPKKAFHSTFDSLEGPRLVEIDFQFADRIALSYAITIHKSQGSEFQVVVIPVTMSHAFMWVRSLIYTGMSRAKRLLIFVGEEEALKLAVKKVSPRRNTLLGFRLNNPFLGR